MRIHNVGASYFQKIKKDKPVSNGSRSEAFKVLFFTEGCGLGDALLAYCIIKAYKKKHPEADITLATPFMKNYSPIFTYCKFCNFQYARYPQFFIWLQDDTYDVVTMLRKKTFSKFSKRIAGLGGIKEAYGRQVSYYGERLQEDPWSVSGSSPIYGNGDKYIGEVMGYLHDIDMDISDMNDIVGNVAPRVVLPCQDYITIHQWAYMNPGQSFCTKFWPKEHWEELVRQIESQYGLEVVQIGGANEVQLSDRAISILGRTDVIDAIRIMKRGKLHIDIEGSFIHASAGIGHPAICMMGPTLGYWRHSNSSVEYLSNTVCQFQPCEDRVDGWASDCRNKDHKCMKDISPNDVLQAIGRKIGYH